MKDSLDKIRWLVVALLLSTLPAMAEVRDTLTFDISDLSSETIVGNDETFMRLSIPDCDHLDMVGAPMLPVKYIRLSVPYNATDVSVTATSTSSLTIIPRRIYPAQMPLTTNDEPDTISFVMDSVIYSSNTYWPSNVAELVGDGFYLGENRIVTVAVYPLQYRPNNKMLRKNTQVRLVVQYSLGGTPTNMLVRRGGDLRLQEQESAKTIVRNPEQVHGFAMTEAQIQHMPPVGLLPDSLLTDTAGYGYGGELQQAWGDRARYLIVTTRELAPSFKRLAALKRQKGYSVQIKCIEDILADPRVQLGDVFRDRQGNIISAINDDAGKLRQYLKLAHSFDNTQFVLLGGKEVPFRYGYNDSILTTRGKHFYSVPTDWYYNDLTTNWNLDDDSFYGEYKNLNSPNAFDREPELFVGRLMAENSSQLNNYIDKLLRYELNPGNGDASYLGHCLFTEASLFNNIESVALEFENVFDDSDIMKQSSDTLLYPTGEELMSAFNMHPYGFLTIYGHGSPKCIKVCAAQNQSSYLFSLDVYQTGYHSSSINLMANKYTPGVCYSLSCFNMPFDVPANYMVFNLGQSYTLGNNYGGVAFLGNTRATFHSIGDSEYGCNRLIKRFASQLLLGNTKCGIAEALSKSMNNDIYINMVHNLMGDPEFDISTSPPARHDSILVVRGDCSISVNNMSQGLDLNIALSAGSSAPLLKRTNNGACTFYPVNPNSPVMIYTHNYLPYIAPLYLQNERIAQSQYVIANDVFAGNAVDPNRATGNLTIAAGTRYEIDAKGVVLLAPGFKVEKGALFSVTQSDY